MHPYGIKIFNYKKRKKKKILPDPKSLDGKKSELNNE